MISSLLLAGCTKAASSPSQPSPSPEAQSAVSNQNQVTGSIKDLMNMGKDMHCTWEVEVDQGKTKGEIYVSGNQYRANMNVQSSQGKMNSYSISDGTWMYQWGDMTPQGTKINLDQFKNMAPDTQNKQPAEAQNAYQSLNKKYSYKCDSWQVDQTQFKIPSDVKFVDLGETMKQIQNLQNGSGDVCAACNFLSGDAKTQCLANCK